MSVEEREDDATVFEFIDIDVAQELGADGDTSDQQISFYIPNQDAHHNPIPDQSIWVTEALELLAEINGGATAMPPVEGAWFNDEGEIVKDQPIIVYSFIRPAAFVAAMGRIREFLHRMGRETNQGEVAFELNGVFYRIRHFDGSVVKEVRYE